MVANSDSKNFQILVADDGSEHSQAAVNLLGDMNFSGKSKVHVLRVITPLQAAEHVAFETSLEATRSALSNKGLDAHSELVLGYPAEKIIEYAEALCPDLIVLGAKGLRSTIGILLGGVAQQVVEYACCPVLIVRAPYKDLSRILMVSDGSESSLGAVRYFGTLPKLEDAKIEIMNVLPPPPIPFSVIEPMFTDYSIAQTWEVTEEEADRRKKEEEEGENLLQKIKEMMKSSGYDTSTIIKRGDAASEIIDYVKTNNVKLIVTGSRGLGNFRSWLMGSVSRKLVHYSDCSVLVVRGDQE